MFSMLLLFFVFSTLARLTLAKEHYGRAKEAERTPSSMRTPSTVPDLSLCYGPGKKHPGYGSLAARPGVGLSALRCPELSRNYPGIISELSWNYFGKSSSLPKLKIGFRLDETSLWGLELALGIIPELFRNYPGIIVAGRWQDRGSEPPCHTCRGPG